MYLLLFFMLLLSISSSCVDDNTQKFKCQGKTFKNVTLTAYYPDFDEELSDEQYLDLRGKKLRTLQDFLDGRAEFVTLAMDQKLGIPYGTPVHIPELNDHFGRRIALQVRDNGTDLEHKGFNRADICVRTEADSYDNIVNGLVTLVF